MLHFWLYELQQRLALLGRKAVAAVSGPFGAHEQSIKSKVPRATMPWQAGPKGCTSPPRGV